MRREPCRPPLPDSAFPVATDIASPSEKKSSRARVKRAHRNMQMICCRRGRAHVHMRRFCVAKFVRGQNYIPRGQNYMKRGQN